MQKTNTKSFVINLSLVFILLSILFLPKSSMEAAKKGLLLWFNVIIPTLFPFILISNIIIHSEIINLINLLLTPIMRRIFHLPGTAGYALVTGLLSGYPVGAKITADLLNKRVISLNQAQYMMTFCNNANPMFIIGFIATGLLDNSSLGVKMIFAIYISSLITAFLYRFFYYKNLSYTSNEVYLRKSYNLITFSLFDDCIMDAISLIVKIGGYIIFFSIILNCFIILPIGDYLLKDFLYSTIELANGIKLLADTDTTLNVKFVLLSSLTAFGTFSVHAQTASVISNSNINMFKYIIAKLINAIITSIIAFIIISFF